MGIATTTAIALGVGAAGAIAGAVGGATGSQKTSTQSNQQTSGIKLADASQFEQQAGAAQQGAFGQLQSFVGAGPGQSDVEAGTGAQRDLASLLQQYQQGGNVPSGADVQRAGSYAASQFAGQRLGAQQAAMEAQQQFSQAAAVQGRGGLDPVFRNKVAQQQQQQEAMIGAQQGAFARQFAEQQPGQRLGFASQRANVLGGLASQAMQNRQALLSLGSQAQAAERNFRVATGERYETGNRSTTDTTPGSVGAALSGGLSGFASGVSAVGGIGKMFGAGGGNPTPEQQSSQSLNVLPQAPSGGNIFGVQTNFDLGRK